MDAFTVLLSVGWTLVISLQLFNLRRTIKTTALMKETNALMERSLELSKARLRRLEVGK